MWVRSQDRQDIVNVEVFRIEYGCSIFGYCDNSSYCIGEYHDEFEAMDVLDEIMGRLNDDCYQVYEMPVSQYYEGVAKDDDETGKSKEVVAKAWENPKYNVPDDNDDECPF